MRQVVEEERDQDVSAIGADEADERVIAVGGIFVGHSHHEGVPIVLDGSWQQLQAVFHHVVPRQDATPEAAAHEVFRVFLVLRVVVFGAHAVAHEAPLALEEVAAARFLVFDLRIGHCDFLKAIGGVGVVGVQVRVVLSRFAAVALFDLLVVGVFGHFEHFECIALFPLLWFARR